MSADGVDSHGGAAAAAAAAEPAVHPLPLQQDAVAADPIPAAEPPAPDAVAAAPTPAVQEAQPALVETPAAMALEEKQDNPPPAVDAAASASESATSNETQEVAPSAETPLQETSSAPDMSSTLPTKREIKSDFLKTRLQAFSSATPAPSQDFNRSAKDINLSGRPKGVFKGANFNHTVGSADLAAMKVDAANTIVSNRPTVAPKKMTGKINAWEKVVAQGAGIPSSTTVEDAAAAVHPAEGVEHPSSLIISPSMKIMERMASLDLSKVSAAGKPPPSGAAPGAPENPEGELPPQKREDLYEDRIINRPTIPNPRRRKTHETHSELIGKLEKVENFDKLQNESSSEDDSPVKHGLKGSIASVPNCCTSGELSLAAMLSGWFSSFFAGSQNTSATAPATVPTVVDQGAPEPALS